ncbi:ribonuclease [Candidatus Arthromitus sp. SFB-mouse-Japan]|uniref:ribonuclease HII n=1 Tax=unclassified Candidatus Neoarthromitus TaxID=2638829 RepID=UPI00021B8094|nr:MULTISPECIES: ribonuclease HII [unclassified Candidatus Arthromitus]EIA23466.1 Ribonuclease HII [Candidatus Arthromitus sp. SFB-1]EIA25311.1 Ribonuclease HII [Candidatus Arthromitus sp. SFB-2]EIA26390.1 Ribonuclease HII [Candidatus Arthromitus sp. SFB-4]EIA26737.1 Ribonuclease HII [Candidatus Arthromitus sp. SFB-5]EIA26778.1 Ribonuclease HII [Candidatus Arthromitus sp. SFB-3]EIA28611.1 Ribonuclease HII [Candidatus Arthromitus sp. SFB-co]EIA30724.1 Ribonuclease HII [Candidatus Arthromitus 
MDFKNLTVSQIKNLLNEIEIIDENIDEVINSLLKDVRISVNKLAKQVENKYDILKNNRIMNEKFYGFDKEYILNNNYVVAGCDEVGRGPLAGPIVCASVVLDLYNSSKIISDINDSKKIKSRYFRKVLSDKIMENAKNFKIIEISNDEIDNIGISEANQKGFRDSILGLNMDIDLVLSDGYPVKNLNFRNIHVVKGDTKSASIMCASIIAKVYRDELMFRYHDEFPQYDFLNNVGYGTKKHLEAIKKFGICKYHRKTFLKNYI